MEVLVKMLEDAQQAKKGVNIILSNGTSLGGQVLTIDVKGNGVILDNSPHAIQGALLDHVIAVQQYGSKGKRTKKKKS